MIGIELDLPCAEIRSKLLTEHHVFTGNSNDPNVLRILPALNVTEKEADLFIEALESVLQNN
jgi:acetylornithine aminotransferase